MIFIEFDLDVKVTKAVSDKYSAAKAISDIINWSGGSEMFLAAVCVTVAYFIIYCIKNLYLLFIDFYLNSGLR
jgi:hypothetical protein